jgi:hypothetical protein
MARRTTKSSSGTSKTAAKSRAKGTESAGRSRSSTKATAGRRSAPKATGSKRSPSREAGAKRSSSKAVGRARSSATTRAKRSRKQSRSGVSATVATLVEKTPKPVLAGSAAVAGIAVIAAGLALKPKHRGNSVGDGLVRAGERIGKLGSDIQHAGDTAQNVGDALSK